MDKLIEKLYPKTAINGFENSTLQSNSNAVKSENIIFSFT